MTYNDLKRIYRIIIRERANMPIPIDSKWFVNSNEYKDTINERMDDLEWAICAIDEELTLCERNK